MLDSRIGVKNRSEPFSVDSNWQQSKQPGGTFKLNKHDDKFNQVIYDIYENNPSLRDVAAKFLSHKEKEQILTINSSNENNKRWEITRKGN